MKMDDIALVAAGLAIATAGWFAYREYSYRRFMANADEFTDRIIDGYPNLF
jgi:hypothetical protein